MTFVSPTSGWGETCRIDAPALLVTHDGGVTWKLQRLPSALIDGGCPCEAPLPVFFNDNQGILLGSVLLATSDGGTTWVERSLPPPIASCCGSAVWRGFQVDFLDANIGWAIAPPPGWKKASPVRDWLYRTSDGGQTWALAGVRNSVPFVEVVAPSARFEQDRTIFACAGDGLYRSLDGGEGWQPVLVGSRMLSVASASTEGHESLVLAASETDGVLRSEDGGRTWTGANAGLLDLTALALALSPQFASDRLGFAGTASGLYRTRNGARSWRAVETDLAEPAVQCVVISPTFAVDRLVLAGTEADGLLRSDNAGSTCSSK